MKTMKTAASQTPFEGSYWGVSYWEPLGARWSLKRSMGSKTNSHLHDQWLCHHGDLTTTYSGIMDFFWIGRGYHSDHLDDETHIFVWASCFWFCIPPPRPPPRPPPPPPRHPPSFTHHLSHTTLSRTNLHIQLVLLLDPPPHPLSFLPSPSPLQHLLLIIIGRSWLVGLSGPFIFFSRPHVAALEWWLGLGSLSQTTASNFSD